MRAKPSAVSYNVTAQFVLDVLWIAFASIDFHRRKVEDAFDPFVLRGQLRCVRCGRIMTTASAKAKTRLAGPLRYYRCRASGSCRGTQVRADEIEQRVLRWLQSPRRAQVESEAGLVFAAFEPIWFVLLPETIRSLVHQLIWEVRWNARSNRLVVMLDTIALHEYARSFAARAMRPRLESRHRSVVGNAVARLCTEGAERFGQHC